MKKTPLYDQHQLLGARCIEFGGYLMPVSYEGIKQEHHAVRSDAGVFDVSHMGEFFVTGQDAQPFLQMLLINDVDACPPGKAQYTAMCQEDGGVLDDCLLYCRSKEEWLMVVNAANIEKDWAWVTKLKNTHFAEADVQLENRSDDMGLLALQGPSSLDYLQPFTEVDLHSIPFYAFTLGTVCGVPDVWIATTGYTGEKGVELYIPTDKADGIQAIWTALLEAGAVPCGLGARDTLRLEKGFNLYGQDMDETVSPLEARMGWVLKLGAGDFVGHEAISSQKESGEYRRLIGFVMDEPRAIPRSGYNVVDTDNTIVGHVTSGTQSITLGQGIGMARVDKREGLNLEEGSTIAIQIRGESKPATITKPPFVR
ncbi:MAG: glycine cleavage system aminomethyltransferase GcvT [Balneolaceae bacterium]|nr:glycine cleavage system aminomethyltransferase GcvT [Balneolaceae bacterium]MDR9446382.1 glycine cleavage system aminomethyltransferase GcvT [Balneolaceae bacterium]